MVKILFGENELKKLLKYLKGCTAETILGPLGKLCEATLELIVPLILASLIDKGIEGGDKSHIIKMSIMLVLLGFIGLAFSVVAQYFSAKAAVGFITKTRHALFCHLGTLSYSDVDKLGTSTMITRMTADMSKVQTGLNLALRLLLRSPFVVFGAMIMAFTIDSGAGLTFAVTIPLLSIVVFGIMILTMPLYKKVQGGVDKILVKTRENLSGVRVIRAFGKEEEEVLKFREENEELTHVQKYVGKISALLNPLTYVIINFGIVFLIYVGALKVDIGDLSQGEVIALYNYMSQILVELIKLANLIITISKALASASRISSVFDIESSQNFGTREHGNEGEFAVEFKNVALKYATASENSVEGVSFSARKGETIGIIGGTGSGKTSLVNLIPRFYDATEGEILIDNAPIKEYTKNALTKKIAIVPQKAILFSGTIEENLRLGNENATEEEINHAIEIAQAKDVVDAKGGLTSKIEGGGKNLSGGQRQRLTIARALVKNSEILILDDSTSALDYSTDMKLRQALHNIGNNATIFIISQRTSSVMYADKIIVLDDGKVNAIGKHDELLSSSDVYKEIYESQFGKEAVR